MTGRKNPRGVLNGTDTGFTLRPLTHADLHCWLRNLRIIPELPPEGYSWCPTCLRILKRMRTE